MTIKLYYAPNACSLASHIALEKAGQPYSVERISLRDGEHKSERFTKINPKAQVPVLDVDGKILTEGPAILTFLADHYPEAQLLPGVGSWQRVRAIEWLTFVSTSIHGTFGAVFHPESYLDDPSQAEALRQTALKKLSHLLTLTEARLEDQPFLSGSFATVADYYLYVTLRWLQAVAPGTLNQFPQLNALYARIEALPEVSRALANEQLQKAA